jgi:hypothetical protein
MTVGKWRKRHRELGLEGLHDELRPGRLSTNDAAITRLVGSQLLKQQEEWQLEHRRFFSEATMAKIPETEEPLELTDADAANQPATAINPKPQPRLPRSTQNSTTWLTDTTAKPVATERVSPDWVGREP